MQMQLAVRSAPPRCRVSGGACARESRAGNGAAHAHSRSRVRASNCFSFSLEKKNAQQRSPPRPRRPPPARRRRRRGTRRCCSPCCPWLWLWLLAVCALLEEGLAHTQDAQRARTARRRCDAAAALAAASPLFLIWSCPIVSFKCALLFSPCFSSSQQGSAEQKRGTAKAAVCALFQKTICCALFRRAASGVDVFEAYE